MTLALTLSGCFANPLDQLTDRIGAGIAEGGAEKIVEGMTGGTFDMETGKLPADFPAEIPLVDGAIQSGMGMKVEEGKTWTITILVDDAQSALQTARDDLTGAGYEETLWNDAQGMTMGMFSNDTYGVIISGMFSDDDDQVISYQVIQDTSTK